MTRLLLHALCGFALMLAAPNFLVSADYDPLAIRDSFVAQRLKIEANDSERDRRIPLSIDLPAEVSAQPVVLFSHGLGGDREACRYLGKHWSARGYVVVFMQHPGSDSAIWQDVPRRQRMAAMREAASAQNFMLRVEDVKAILDQLARWNQTPSHPLANRLDLKHVGMSGHSFGAKTTQAVSGQRSRWLADRAIDRRITAAIAMSPSTSTQEDPAISFGQVSIPWLLMTGTNDVSQLSDQTVQTRLAVYPALPTGDKYELVLDRAEHSAFTDDKILSRRSKTNPNHHRAILGISTAFWDSYLRDDESAKKWLTEETVRSVLEPKDRFRFK